MSYLDRVRLHFAGEFRADVSTVNNAPGRYDIGAFSKSFWLPFSGASDLSNWQPGGTGAWRIGNCSVTRAVSSDGSDVQSGADRVVGAVIRDASDQASAKIVDLDSNQQGVSMIYGLALRVIDATTRTLLFSGEFAPTAFFDLWFGRSISGGDGGASAFFQSTLRNVKWGDLSNSAFLRALQSASDLHELSIRIVTDNYATNGPRRGYGRIVGTIGPHISGAARHHVVGRHLAPTPGTRAEHVVCRVDGGIGKVLIDVGNALPMDGSTGDFADLGTLNLIATTPSGAVIDLGSIDYRAGSYRETAGIYELPAGRRLTEPELAEIQKQPLELVATGPSGARRALARESPDGIYIRPEQLVVRMDPGDNARVELVASKFGAPLANATIDTEVVVNNGGQPTPVPSVIAPATDATGRAVLVIKANAVGNPRGPLDGQLFLIAFSVQGAADIPFQFDRANLINVLVFSEGVVPDQVSWNDVKNVFQLYHNLYPSPHGPEPYEVPGIAPRHPVVDLSNETSVVKFARHIKRALLLPIDHPNHMPVTRDLSGYERSLLLKWLEQVGQGQQIMAAAAPAGPPASKEEETGGKIAAARRTGFPAIAGQKAPRPVEELSERLRSRRKG